MPGAKEKNEAHRLAKEQAQSEVEQRKRDADIRRKQHKLAEARERLGGRRGPLASMGRGIEQRLGLAKSALGSASEGGRPPRAAPRGSALPPLERESRALLKAREAARQSVEDRATGRDVSSKDRSSAKHRQSGERKKKKKYTSTIPWSLLDELEAEKDRLAAEKAKRLPFERAYDRGRVRKEDALTSIADEA